MKTRIVIIGAGPGGYVAGVRAAQLGAEVTIIEQEEVGGSELGNVSLEHGSSLPWARARVGFP